MLTELERKDLHIKKIASAHARLEGKYHELKEQHDSLVKSFNAYPSDRWYIAYLQKEIMRLEVQYADLQENFHLLVADHQKKSHITEHFILAEDV